MTNELLENPDFLSSGPGRTLKNLPLGFVDIGARGGIHGIVDRIAGVTAVLAFEPDREECERLLRDTVGSPWANYTVKPVAIAEKAGHADLYVTASPVNCSLRRPNQAYVKRYGMKGFEVVRTVTLETSPLDSVIFSDAESVRHGEFIKMDTQGTEFEILQGGRRTLSERAVALLVEVEFFQMYEGQRLFSEVELCLREQGFSFYGFDLRCRSAKLLNKTRMAGRERTFYADAVFFKDPLGSPSANRQMTERELHVLFTCALLLGYYDFALQVALETWAEGEEASRIRRVVESEASKLAISAETEVLSLADRIRKDPSRANVEVGKLVDRRRALADFDDVRL